MHSFVCFMLNVTAKTNRGLTLSRQLILMTAFSTSLSLHIIELIAVDCVVTLSVLENVSYLLTAEGARGKRRGIEDTSTVK